MTLHMIFVVMWLVTVVAVGGINYYVNNYLNDRRHFLAACVWMTVAGWVQHIGGIGIIGLVIFTTLEWYNT